jgi:hypothetical protein
MTTQIVYVYDDYGNFNHDYEAQENPKEPGTFITPINSTTIAPKFSVGHCSVFADGYWTNVIDLRGSIWNMSTGLESQQELVGPLPIGFTNVPKPVGYYVWHISAWVIDVSKVPIDVVGFTVALTALVGGALAFNGIVQAYPMLLFSINNALWGDVSALLCDANKVSLLTDKQCADIEIEAQKFLVPIVLTLSK